MTPGQWITAVKRRDLARLANGRTVVLVGWQPRKRRVRVEFRAGSLASVKPEEIIEVWQSNERRN